MTRNTRDEFPVRVKRVLALRVNQRCSNPLCGAATGGPAANPSKHLNIGVAAHMTAAAPAGPRYDATLTQQQRRSPENGIWLCQSCAKLSDDDADRFSEQLLRHWKASAEANAFDQIGKRSPFERFEGPKLEILSTTLTHSPYLAAPLAPPATLIQGIRERFPDQFREIDQIKLLSSGLGVLGHPYLVVALGANHGWDWKVLFFAASEFGWELVGRIPLQGQRAYVPEALYVPGLPGALALTHVVGSGTGLLRRSTSWYRLARSEPTPLLSYPYYFYVSGWGMPFGRQLTSKILTVPHALTQGARLDLRFDIEYEMLDDTEARAHEADAGRVMTTETLSLEWSESTQNFIPRSATDDFAKIEDLWNEGTEGFVRRNISQLHELERVGTDRQRQFIKKYFLEELP
jgi:hypothetical protein